MLLLGAIFCSGAYGAAISASWDAVTQDINNNAETVSYYRLHYGTTSRGASTSISGYTNHVTINSGTSTTVNSLNWDTQYYFAVTAVDLAGNEGDPSTEVAYRTEALTIPTAPSGLSATAASSTQINLSWTDSSSNEDGFRIERSTTSGSGFSEIATVAANVHAYSNTSLTASTTYYYRVRSYNGAGNSSYTSEASARTQDPAVVIPTAPSGLSAAAVSSSQINLSWTDASNNETGFRIERSLSSTSGFSEIATVAANVTTYNNNTGLSADTTYYYRVRSYNTAGNSASYSNTANARTYVALPIAPSNLSAAASGYNQINLSWQDNSSNETSFKLQRKLQGGSTYADIASVAANQASYQDTAVSPETGYTYRICASNSAGDSTFSNESSATTGTAPVGLPDAPSNLSVSQVAADTITLEWDDNSRNEDGFRIERKNGDSGAYEEIQTTASNISQIEDKAIEADTKYTYRVRAFNTTGDSVFSGEIAITTDARDPHADQSGGPLYEVTGSGCGLIEKTDGKPADSSSKMILYVVLIIIIAAFMRPRIRG